MFGSVFTRLISSFWYMLLCFTLRCSVRFCLLLLIYLCVWQAGRLPPSVVPLLRRAEVSDSPPALRSAHVGAETSLREPPCGLPQGLSRLACCIPRGAFVLLIIFSSSISLLSCVLLPLVLTRYILCSFSSFAFCCFCLVFGDSAAFFVSF